MNNSFKIASLVFVVSALGAWTSSSAQEKHADGGILGQYVTLLESINDKLSKLSNSPPAAVASKRTPFTNEVTLAECGSGGQVVCNQVASQLCSELSYTKGRAILNDPSAQNFRRMVCYD